MRLFESKQISKFTEADHPKKYSSNKIDKKQVYLLSKSEVIAERDRIEALYDEGKQSKEDEARMRELNNRSAKAFGTPLSKLTETGKYGYVNREAIVFANNNGDYNRMLTFLRSKNEPMLPRVSTGFDKKLVYFYFDKENEAWSRSDGSRTNATKKISVDDFQTNKLVEADSKGNALFNQGDPVSVKGIKQNGKVLFGRHNGMVAVKFQDGSEGEFNQKDLTKLSEGIFDRYTEEIKKALEEGNKRNQDKK